MTANYANDDQLDLLPQGSMAPGSLAGAERPASGTGVRHRTLLMPDGYRLPLVSWEPAGPVKATLIAVHAFGDFRLAFTSGVSANGVCFERELLEHYRLVFERT